MIIHTQNDMTNEHSDSNQHRSMHHFLSCFKSHLFLIPTGSANKNSSLRASPVRISNRSNKVSSSNPCTSFSVLRISFDVGPLGASSLSASANLSIFSAIIEVKESPDRCLFKLPEVADDVGSLLL